jgi:hypothetical protein
MLRLAAKLVAFFWRREDGLEEEAGRPGPELVEGARGARVGALHRALWVGWAGWGGWGQWPVNTQGHPSVLEAPGSPRQDAA